MVNEIAKIDHGFAILVAFCVLIPWSRIHVFKGLSCSYGSMPELTKINGFGSI